MALWNAEPLTFRGLRRAQKYILVNNRPEWYNIPISAPPPSAGTITVPPLVSHSNDSKSAGPSDGDLPLGHKPAIESHLCDKTSPMTPPMSPTPRRSLSPPDGGQNSSSDSLLMQPTTLILLPSAPVPSSEHKPSMMIEFPPAQLTPPMSPLLDELASEAPQSGNVMAPTSRMWAQICYGVDLEAPVE
jgi:hypothetical protein